MPFSETRTPSIEDLLKASKASPDFAAAVRQFAAGGKAPGRIEHNPGAPPVKILRVISKLLETYPADAIDSVNIEGQSGCSDFRGKLLVKGSTNRTIRFVWDCAWKARQMNYKSFFGDPDQQKAAQEFGYQCFEVFGEE